jgi:WD40 repeat protein
MPVRMVRSRVARPHSSTVTRRLVGVARLLGHTGRVRSVAVARDCSWLASGSTDGTVRLWSAADGGEIETLEGHTGAVECVVILPTAKHIASGGADRSIRFWSVVAAECVLVRPDAHSRAVTAMAVDGAGALLATGSEDRLVKLWSVLDLDGDGAATCSALHTLRGHADTVQAVSISADGMWLASGSWDGTVRLWTTAGDERSTFGESAVAVTAVALSSRSEWLASGTRDGRLLVWALSAEDPRDSDRAQPRLDVRAHLDKVGSIVVSPDDKLLVSGGRDDHVRVHCVRTGEMLCEDKAHTDNVAGLACAMDSRGVLVASASHDFTVRLWRVLEQSGAIAGG